MDKEDYCHGGLDGDGNDDSDDKRDDDDDDDDDDEYYNYEGGDYNDYNLALYSSAWTCFPLDNPRSFSSSFLGH